MFEVAIILILKDAAVLSRIREHFTGSYQEYTVEQFIDFLRDTTIETSESE